MALENGPTNSGVERRNVLKTLGVGGTVGIASLTSARATSALETTTSNVSALLREPEWTLTRTVDEDIGNNLCVTLGYFGSETAQRWVGDVIKERWAHKFELSTVGVCEYRADGCYNIYSQEFEAKQEYDHHPVEIHEYPRAGAAAWPDPPGGNWDKVLLAILEEAVTELSAIADSVKGASEIYDAYKQTGFDTEQLRKITFQNNYRTVSRKEASHSVRFTLDTIPEGMGTAGTARITGGVGESGYDSVSGSFTVHMGNEFANPPAPLDRGGVRDSESLRDSLDSMSGKELKEHGITRIHPSDVPRDVAERSRFDLGGSKPSYLKSFPMRVEFEGQTSKGSVAEESPAIDTKG